MFDTFPFSSFLFQSLTDAQTSPCRTSLLRTTPNLCSSSSQNEPTSANIHNAHSWWSVAIRNHVSMRRPLEEEKTMESLAEEKKTREILGGHAGPLHVCALHAGAPHAGLPSQTPNPRTPSTPNIPNRDLHSRPLSVFLQDRPHPSLPTPDPLGGQSTKTKSGPKPVGPQKVLALSAVDRAKVKPKKVCAQQRRHVEVSPRPKSTATFPSDQMQLMMSNANP